MHCVHVGCLLTVSFRYDLLCIEGIARALQVFLKKGRAPEYRLVYPPGGEKDLVEVTVAPEVSQVRQHLLVPSDNAIGSASSPLFRFCYSSKRQVHATLVRIVHRFTGEVTPEYLSEATVRCHRHARSRCHHGAVPLRGQATQRHKICSTEQDASVHCGRVDDGLRSEQKIKCG